MSAPILAQVPDTARARMRSHAVRRAPALPGVQALVARLGMRLPAFRRSQLTGAALALVAVGFVELLQRPAGIEPAAFVPIIVVAAGAIGGLLGALSAAAIGIAYAALFYSQPAWVTLPGNGARIVATVGATVAAVWLSAVLRQRFEAARRRAARERLRGELTHSFTLALAEVTEDALPEAIVRRAAELTRADLAVLTVLEPHSGRHFVRAVHGSAASAVGVEVVPGVGPTGQAIRERRTIISGTTDASAAPGAGAAGRPSTHRPQTVIATPALQAGRVIATLTVGRPADRQGFAAEERTALELVMPLIALGVSGALLHRGSEEASLRDATTGLHNRAYLDAALEQLLALRKRTPPTERQPLSTIMFDIDSFRLLNDRHGRVVGDQVLRAVSTLLRQRFRASDIMARVGPDSFFVVLNGASGEVAAEAAAQIRRQVRELTLSNARGEPVVISISAGCAMAHDGERPEGLLRSAEAALETARWSGPGAVVSI